MLAYVANESIVANASNHGQYSFVNWKSDCGSASLKILTEQNHELLPSEIKEKLPPLYSGEALGLLAIALVKFFTPDSNWTWYATEFDGTDTFFGLVSGFELELGYFLLSELAGIAGPLGLSIERDIHFQPKTLKELYAIHGKPQE